MKKRGNEIKKEFLKTMIQLATAGFGLTAALAWNTAIQSIITRLVPVGNSDIVQKLIYALIVTAIAVLVTYILGRMIQQAGDEQEKE